MPYQELGERFPEIPRTDLASRVHLVETDGRLVAGALAVFRALDLEGRRTWLWLYRFVPGLRHLSEWLYGFVARHRHAAWGLTRVLWGRDVTIPGFDRSASIYLRSLGLVYVVAFLSLWVQIHGLVGSDGILPATEYLSRAAVHLGWTRFIELPTLGWIGASDAMLHVLCLAGAVGGSLILAGTFSRSLLLLLWLNYLSLTVLGQEFLNYQWDSLLLEAGLLSSFLIPGRSASPGTPMHVRAVRWLLWWLLFRLILQSGIVKLASGDPAWSGLTALSFHFETQPWPTWVGWWAQQLPGPLLRAATIAVLAAELSLPFLIWAPRRIRHIAALVMILYQLLISVTGNNGYLNILTAALCVLLLDDRFWLPRQAPQVCVPATSHRTPRRYVAATVWALYIAVSSIQMLSVLGRPQVELALKPALRWVDSFRSINRYGMFAVMTTHRPEVIVLGSHDGEYWKEYEFRFKPGSPTEQPRLLPGHLPRLDWGMWFAALGGYRRQPWSLQFLQTLLEPRPAVLGLLANNPFPGVPPTYIRAVVFDYRFTDRATRTQSYAWWSRRELGPFCPVLSLNKTGPLALQPTLDSDARHRGRRQRIVDRADLPADSVNHPRADHYQGNPITPHGGVCVVYPGFRFGEAESLGLSVCATRNQ